jgi:hypothetical protein
MERDQPGGSSLTHRYVSANGASTSYHRDLPAQEVPESALRVAQDHDQAQDQA